MSYQIELRHLRYFLAVAEELHFRRAAERLFISQPGLTTQIKRLEQVLQTDLFIRDKKTVSLTSAGHFFKNEVAFILNHLEQTKKQLRLLDEGDLGELRIGFLGSAMQQVIPDLLVALKNNNPRVRTSLDELSNRAQISSLQKDQLDIGFVRLKRVPEDMVLHPVYEDTFSVVLPKSHPVNASNFKGMQQLAQEDFILFSQAYSPLYFDKVMSICEDAGFTPKISHKSVHAHTIFKLVENELGIAIVPTALQYGFHMQVSFIELQYIKQRAVLSAVWKKNNRNPVLQPALKLLKKLHE